MCRMAVLRRGPPAVDRMPAPRAHPAAFAATQRAARLELTRRARLPAAVTALLDGLFGEQRRLVECTDRRIVTCAGRRSGKTHALVARAVRAAAANPRRTIPVFQRTQTSSGSRVFWKALVELDAAFTLGCRFHNSLYLATLPNNSEIIILGADTADGADKARGDAYPEAIIDEAGTLRPHILSYLLDDVLAPALFDYGGTVVLAGTPNVRPVGPFAEACATSGVNANAAAGWTQFHWTLFDNPHLPKDEGSADLDAATRATLRDTQFRAEMAARGHDLNDPYVQREYFGRWVHDSSMLAYRVPDYAWRGVVAPDDLWSRPRNYAWTCGIDMGFNDPTAFVLVARCRRTGTLWVVESSEASGLIPSAVCARLAAIRARVGRFDHPVVADTGGYGKGPAAEMASARWGFAVQPARKSPGYKPTAREFLSGDLATGRVRIIEASNPDLIHDLTSLRVTEDGDDDPRDPNHLPDALLYVAMALASTDRGFGDRSRVVLPGTPEWEAALDASMEAAAIDALRRAHTVDDPGIVDLPEY